MEKIIWSAFTLVRARLATVNTGAHRMVSIFARLPFRGGAPRKAKRDNERIYAGRDPSAGEHCICLEPLGAAHPHVASTMCTPVRKAPLAMDNEAHLSPTAPPRVPLSRFAPRTSAPSRPQAQTHCAAHLIIGVLKRKRVPAPEPILKRDPRLAQIILLEHILVPHDELHDAELVREREVDGKVEGRVLGAVGRIYCPLRNGGLVLVPEQGDDNEAEGAHGGTPALASHAVHRVRTRMNRSACAVDSKKGAEPIARSSSQGGKEKRVKVEAGKREKDEKVSSKHNTHGSLEPLRSFASRLVQLRTCTLSMTIGCSPGKGANPRPPRPPDTRAGSRFRARPILSAFFLGAGAISEGLFVRLSRRASRCASSVLRHGYGVHRWQVCVLR